MPSRARPVLRKRTPAPVVLHSAPLVLPISAEPVRDGAVAVRGDRVLRVGARSDLLAALPVVREHRWPGTVVAGLVDACSSAPGPGVTARAEVVTDLAEAAGLAGVAYVRVACRSEHDWEESGRDALITAIREADLPCAVGVAAHTPDPQVLEDVAVLARTFGLRLLADAGRHSLAALDEAGVLGPHCHVACARPLDPGERKLLRLRGSVAAVCPAAADDFLALFDEGNRVALGSGATGLLGQAHAIREQARRRGSRVRELDRRLVEAATSGGARALGLHRGAARIGSLGPGSRADFAVFDAGGRHPYAALLAQPPCLATVVGGAIT
ncbi:hypothetical protein ABT294_19290 [Nonomuraea sp. NPDC000554]|uniref:amidohydrolase family protein n=1 Tax=Nonomuraea sp. NPDC000554 TaxID=3154259 RepID=UPI003323DA65